MATRAKADWTGKIRADLVYDQTNNTIKQATNIPYQAAKTLTTKMYNDTDPSNLVPLAIPIVLGVDNNQYYVKDGHMFLYDAPLATEHRAQASEAD